MTPISTRDTGEAPRRLTQLRLRILQVERRKPTCVSYLLLCNKLPYRWLKTTTTTMHSFLFLRFSGSGTWEHLVGRFWLRGPLRGSHWGASPGGWPWDTRLELAEGFSRWVPHVAYVSAWAVCGWETPIPALGGLAQGRSSVSSGVIQGDKEETQFMTQPRKCPNYHCSCPIGVTGQQLYSRGGTTHSVVGHLWGCLWHQSSGVLSTCDPMLACGALTYLGLGDHRW